MATPDAATVAQQAVKLGLVTNAQMQECKQEVGKLGADPNPLIRVLEKKGYITPWQTQKLLKGEKDGYFLGGFRLLYRISAGTFGRVFRGDDPRTGTVVAVKVLRRRHTDNQRHVELFEREGKMGLTLRHPNIVSILAVNRDAPSKQYFMVMEFVEGGNLRDILKIRKKLEPPEALRILEDAAAGLAYAYTRGLTHRDIKPTNILISTQGTAKLVDFGLAGFNAAAATQEDEQVDRTVDYAGLEKATGVKEGDVRSDIYFLGCVFYEMLTGRPPMEPTKDKQARMQSHRFENIKPISADEVGGHASVIRLLDQMMALNPMQRFQTPAQLLEAIRETRREVEGGGKGQAETPAEPSVFVVEKNPKYQDVMREKFKEMGYRVFISTDPGTALNRFRQKPFDALVLDSGTVGEDALDTFERILGEAERQKHPLAGILLPGPDQDERASKLAQKPRVVAMPRPLTLKAVCKKLRELVPVPSPAPEG